MLWSGQATLSKGHLFTYIFASMTIHWCAAEIIDFLQIYLFNGTLILSWFLQASTRWIFLTVVSRPWATAPIPSKASWQMSNTRARQFFHQSQRKDTVQTSEFRQNAIHSYSPVDCQTLPVDCQNFLAHTAALLCCLLLWQKTMRANFSHHTYQECMPPRKKTFSSTTWALC